MKRYSEFTPDSHMIINHSKELKTITNLNRGTTAVLFHGQVMELWPEISITEFEKRQSELPNKTFTTIQLN